MLYGRIIRLLEDGFLDNSRSPSEVVRDTTQGEGFEGLQSCEIRIVAFDRTGIVERVRDRSRKAY